MKQVRISETVENFDFNSVQKVNTNVHILSKYPEGLFLLDENANVLDKNADSYPSGTIKAYGFKAGDGNYYAVDAEVIPDRKFWGGYYKPIDSLESFKNASDAKEDYAGESNTTKIIEALAGYNDGYTTGAPAAEACRLRTFNGKSGYLPSAGELRYGIFLLREELNSLITKFNLEPLDSTLWVSTQYNDKRAWSVSWETGQVANLPRSSSLTSRAFFVW